jgi:hypothetical protein
VYGERWCPGQWQALRPQGNDAGSCLHVLPTPQSPDRSVQAVDKPRQRLDCPRLVRGCQSARSYATLLVGRAPHTPPLSLRSEVGRVVFLLEGLCAALRVPWPPALLSCQNLRCPRAALRFAPAVLSLWRRRKVILWSLLRQGPLRSPASPGPRLDTRSLRIGLRRVERKHKNCRGKPHPVEQNAKSCHRRFSPWHESSWPGDSPLKPAAQSPGRKT